MGAAAGIRVRIVQQTVQYGSKPHAVLGLGAGQLKQGAAQATAEMIRLLRFRDMPCRSKQPQRGCVATLQQRLGGRVDDRSIHAVEKQPADCGLYRFAPHDSAQMTSGGGPVRPQPRSSQAQGLIRFHRYIIPVLDACGRSEDLLIVPSRGLPGRPAWHDLLPLSYG
ncbi:hypothetical protein Asi03nite_26500 [Actinoplanes siamensis]|uniref:Uncharacterized protein n=1 Tax=Actinoplanes siamensis TaxID=1223317 RepID=A0A919N678_9ACTN|nr:hypothetical protein Asi03nite_26500 [Actinoplanes siamensis]